MSTDKQLPGFQDYLNALRNPQFLHDPELREGQLVMTSRGRPLSYTGNFALTVAFEVSGVRYAVRCFLRRIPGVAERYAAISEFVRQWRDEAHILADIEYQDKGILVSGTWYPICKMEWVDGLTLDRYIETNLGYLPGLAGLPNQFLHVVRLLHNIGCAHGDLQHGNIIADGNRLRLVDYDGMFVPAFVGLKMQSTDIGHRHYQHPQRTEHDFHLQVDNFSTLSIYLSLKALEYDPKVYEHEEEAVFLRASDYRNPRRSGRLSQLYDLGFETAVERFINYCEGDLADVPDLISFLASDEALYSDLSAAGRRRLGVTPSFEVSPPAAPAASDESPFEAEPPPAADLPVEESPPAPQSPRPTYRPTPQSSGFFAPLSDHPDYGDSQQTGNAPAQPQRSRFVPGGAEPAFAPISSFMEPSYQPPPTQPPPQQPPPTQQQPPPQQPAPEEQSAPEEAAPAPQLSFAGGSIDPHATMDESIEEEPSHPQDPYTAELDDDEELPEPNIEDLIDSVYDDPVVEEHEVVGPMMSFEEDSSRLNLVIELVELALYTDLDLAERVQEAEAFIADCHLTSTDVEMWVAGTTSQHEYKLRRQAADDVFDLVPQPWDRLHR